MKKALIILLVVVMVVTSASMVFAGRPDFAGRPANGPGQALPPGGQSIAAIASEAGFSELVGALVFVDKELGTDLVGLFSEGTEQYTVFAPTNEAFFALYNALGDEVQKIEDIDPELVLEVLLYHVAEGRRAANSVVPRVGERSITTLLGESFSVNTSGVINENSQIVSANIPASNGIIHVINEVLIP